MMNATLKLALMATTAGFALAACGDDNSSSPGTTEPVTVIVNPPTTPPTTPTPPTTNPDVTVDLVPNNNCPAGTTLETVTLPGTTSSAEACTLSGNITSDVTLTAENGYILKGKVTVGTDANASASSSSSAAQAPGPGSVTLTIPAGTRLSGAGGLDYLVISRGSKIEAEGTASQPIIMTALQDVLGTVNPNAEGLWGGLVINGSAPINRCGDATATPGTAGCERDGEGASGLYGGGNATDDSGTLSYVQVKYAGNQFTADNELNGIAFQGVGSGTTCNHIQVHNNADDGVEFFGGTVSCNAVVLTGNGDDSLDWTNGWTGNIQRLLIVHSRGAGDQGIEADSNSANNAATPAANPTISNFTMVGQDGDIGGLFREGTQGRIVNGIIVDFPDAGIDVDNDVTLANLQSGALSFKSIFLDNPDNIQSGDDGETVNTEAIITGSDNVVEGLDTLQNRFFPGPNEQAVPADDVSAVPGFEALNYIGAFSPTETPESNWAAGWTFGLFDAAAPTCPTGTTPANTTIDGTEVCRLSGTLSADVRLNNNFLYQVTGQVFVGTDLGTAATADETPVTLRIDAGVTLYADTGRDSIVVPRGNKIEAVGTALNPIVMTSESDVNGQANAATDRGEGISLILNGRAPINRCADATATPGAAGCERDGEGASGLYGGGTADDNSGILRYVRVQYAGFRFTPDNELNGIALQGVGNGTEIDYVQVHNNADDGIEFFGGTANAKHLVLTGNGDDSLDWTNGWTGNVQYVIIDQAADAGDQGFEGDSNSAVNAAIPRADPTFANLTLVGESSTDIGMLLREGTATDIYNAVVTGFGEAGVDIDGPESEAQGTGGGITFSSSLIAGNNPDLADATAGSPEQVATAGRNNVVGGTAPTYSTVGDYTPDATVNAVTATNVSTVDAFFDDAAYVGAVENADDDWYKGWTLLVDQSATP
ncbi:hypothetical protein [uncultured Algimonas sp.]|uniref:hypothetical protein n=1 Tax=uncultured Algimonas sp. TaxID=1547920 RepID=UPI00261E5C16|nr:hypothetical protein [uncultured Algimonas sp.]